MLPGPWRRSGKLARIGKLLREVACNLGERPELRHQHRLENNLLSMPFDHDLCALEAESLGQPDSLAASVLKDFCSRHIYIMYLYIHEGKTRKNGWARGVTAPVAFLWLRALPEISVIHENAIRPTHVIRSA